MMIVRRLSRKSFRWILTHSFWVLGSATICTGFSLWAITYLTVRSNFADLLPEDQPAVQELRRLEKVVGGASFVVLTVETEDPALIPPFFAAIDTRLHGHPDIRYLDYRPPVDFFRRRALLYPPVEELDTFIAHVRRRIDQAKLNNFAVDLTEPGDTAFSLEQFEKKYPFFMQHDRFYQSRDGRLFVMLIKPSGRATDTTFTKRLLGVIDRAVEESRTEVVGVHGGAEDLRVQLTGPYVKALGQNAIALADAKRTAALSLVGMSAFLFLFFRRKRAFCLIGVPLFMSTTWAMGTAYLIFGTLNFFTSLATAVLLGLSADYGIHLYSRYLDCRQTGMDATSALESTFHDLWIALWAAALTTIGGFLALTFSSFTAFYQFGCIIAIGMGYCLLAMLTVFPALTICFARWSPTREAASRKIKRLRNWCGVVGQWAQRPSTFWATTVCCGLAVIPIALGRIQFDYNFGNIMGQQPTRALDRRVDTIFSHSINPEIARTESAADAAAFATAVRAVKARNEQTPGGTRIATALALADFVPPDQDVKTQRIRELRELLTPTVVDNFTTEERATYDRLRPALQPVPVAMRDLPEGVRMKFRDLRDEEGKFLFIFPNFDPQNGRQFMQFVEELRRTECADCRAPVVFSGESVIFYEIITLMFRDGRWVIVASLFAIWLALLSAFRNVRDAVTCFVPFCVGLLWMLGIMGTFNIPFTLVSLAVVPILLGIAIDYPIYLYQQSRLFGPGRSIAAYQAVCPPIFGSAVTTVIGFGCLLTAQNGGAASFGLAAVIGLITCSVATFIWFPGWLAWIERRRAVQTQESGLPPISRTKALENSFIETIPINVRPSMTGK